MKDAKSMEDNKKELDALRKFPFIAGMNKVIVQVGTPIGLIIIAILLLSKVMPIEYLRYICLFYGAYGLGYHYCLVQNKLGHLAYSSISRYWAYISVICWFYFIYTGLFQ